MVTECFAETCVSWVATTWVSDHINDSFGHYFEWDNGQFWRKMFIYMYINMYYTVFTTFFHQLMPLWHDFLQALQFFYYDEKNLLICWLRSCQHDMWCCLAWSSWQNLTVHWLNASTFSWCVSMLAVDLSFDVDQQTQHHFDVCNWDQ